MSVKKQGMVLLGMATLMLGLAAVVWAFNNPIALEIDAVANVGEEATLAQPFDWANSGANTPSRGCPESGGTVHCNGSGGIFDGGHFISSTTPPDPPAPTAAALAVFHTVAFAVDPLSVDVTSCGTGDPDVYTGVGSEKNGDIIDSETFSTGPVPNKDEISNVYAAIDKSAGQNVLYAGFERVVNNGDSHVDLEFLQSEVKKVGDCSGHLAGHRSQGDLLLSVEFTNGGALGGKELHQWDCGTTPPSPQGTICDPPAHGKTTAGYITPPAPIQAAVLQSINSVDAVGCGGWICRNADGTQVGTGPSDRLIAKNQLYELAIDLDAVGFEGCLSTFMPHTRSAAQFTATLKDFKLVPFNTCNPTTKLTKSVDKSVVTTGDSVTYTYTEQNDGDVPLTPPSCPPPALCLAADRNSYVTDDKCSPVSYVSGDTNGNVSLDPGETWTFTCSLSNVTVDTANTAIGHGIFTIGDLSRDVTYCATGNPACDPVAPATIPPGTICDQDECAKASVTVLVPSTTLTKSASISGTLTYTYLEKNDGGVDLLPPSCAAAPCVAADRNSLVTDNNCATVAYVSGDADNDNILDKNETWTLTCTKTISTFGTTTNVATGHGKDNLGRDVTTCPSGPVPGKFCDADETDTNTVTCTVSGGK